MKIMNLKKIGEKVVAAINQIDQEREEIRERYEQTGNIHTWERLIYLDGKIAGIEEIFRILRGEKNEL